MPRLTRRSAAVATAAVAVLFARPAFAQPYNDECATPSPIAGPGEFNLDNLLTATQSTTPPPIPGTTKDVWFCWTPTWNGLASVDVGAALLSAEIFNGCGCPTAGTGSILFLNPVQHSGQFPVQCGQQYLIRVAAELYPFPAQSPVRTINIAKFEGQDCPPPSGQNCANCCGAKPTYQDPLYSTNYTGQVAVVTNNALGRFGNGGQAVTIFNMASTPAPVPGNTWDPVTGPPSTSFRYSRPNWDVATLGSIFPCTLDNQGNIYTAYCVATNIPVGSTLANSTSGSIFRIAAGSGTPSVFCNIPDNAAPPVGGSGAFFDCSMPNTLPPGIGDVCTDCAHNGQFFASAFADGRIYRISPAGTLLEAFDHATNTVGSPAREPGNNYDRYVPRGQRVWAVKEHQGRLYYSIWGQELACDPVPIQPGSQPNTVWSIGLTAAGAFVPNSRRMELQVPIFPTNPPTPPDQKTSAPISDISFSPECRMVLAERQMGENGVIVGAHASRGLEYAWNGVAWVPMFLRSGYGHEVGGNALGQPNTNSAGGAAHDFANGPLPLGRVWFTGDYLNTQLAYGITGLDRLLPAYTSAVHIDYDGGYGVDDKTKLCDVEIPCVKACAVIKDGRILCNPQGPDPYIFTFTFTNNTAIPIQYILLPAAPFGQHVLTLPAPLPPGQTSGPISVPITVGSAGEEFCFDMIFADENVSECCRVRHCVVFPDCTCLQLPLIRTECIPGQPGAFKLFFTVQNLSWYVVNELFIFPPIGSGIVATPDYFPLPPLAQYQTSGILSTTITGAAPGSQLCLRFSIHHSGLECCSEVVCFRVPDPCPDIQEPAPCTPGARCYADCDGSGLLNINDFLCFLNKFAAQDACANCDASTVPPVLNVNDFQCFLTKFAAGCP